MIDIIKEINTITVFSLVLKLLILAFCVRPTAMPSKMACKERASITRKPRNAT